MSDKNFGKLTFSLNQLSYETKMFESWYKNGQWDPGELVPFRPIPLSPAANILNYGQGIFEGMKAYRSVKDRVVMFRPNDNAARFARSGAMLSMAVVDEDKFMNAVRRLVIAYPLPLMRQPPPYQNRGQPDYRIFNRVIPVEVFLTALLRVF
ncbi:MAG: hypothetical protein AAFP70_17350, partial [Calditrichota bacterium]